MNAQRPCRHVISTSIFYNRSSRRALKTRRRQTSCSSGLRAWTTTSEQRSPPTQRRWIWLPPLPAMRTPEATAQLARLGFTESDDGRFVRDCPAHITSRSNLLAKVHPRHRHAEPIELERACSPVALEDGGLECLMVPIKPGYARSLFDTRQAAYDLFGADKSVLLRFQNVYFRKNSHHHMIQAPARILWYVSDSVGVVATSHLDNVQIGPPKDIFRDNRRLGALGWSEIQEMCSGGTVRDIMALEFSHSCPFRSPVDHTSLKRIYSRHSRKLVVQSPSRVPRAVFHDIFRSGFQTRVAV